MDGMEVVELDRNVTRADVVLPRRRQGLPERLELGAVPREALDVARGLCVLLVPNRQAARGLS